MRVTVESRTSSSTISCRKAGTRPALLEEAVAGAYRDRSLTMEQVRQLLGFGTRMQAGTFLQEHEVYDYTAEDFEKDMATMDRLFAKKHGQAQTRSSLPIRAPSIT